jgi:hypothetical protein
VSIEIPASSTNSAEIYGIADAAADFGDVAGCAPALVDDTGVGDAIDRDIGLGRGYAAGSKKHDDRNRR